MTNSTKWLKSFAEKNSLDSKIFADQVGVSTSASRAWMNGLVPRQKYWPSISSALKIPLNEVINNYQEQLKSEDRVINCQVCETEVILWKPHIILCNSNECRRLYDLHRKRNYREILKKHTKVKYRDVNYLFSNPPDKIVHIDKEEHRKEINIAMQKYLEEGNTITMLKPGNAEGTDKITQYLISHGLESMIND